MEKKLVLRPYQKEFINGIYDCIRAGKKRVLGVAATGSGKTLIAAQLIAHAVLKKRHTIFVVHRDILVNQTYQKLTNFGVSECGFIKAGWEENQESLVQIASVQTLPKRDWWQHYPAGLIILDECHITAFSEVVKQMMNRVFPESLYLGLTATPWRLSKREGMGDIFESLVTAPMPRDLIDAGFLIKPSYFTVRQADLEKVGTVAGEFDEAQLALVCDQPELIKQIVEDWKRLAFGRRTIAFAVNVAHSKHLSLFCHSYESEF